MKYILFFLLLSASTSAQIKLSDFKETLTIGFSHGDYHCEPETSEIVDTAYFEGKYNALCHWAYSHRWIYKDKAALTMYPYLHVKSNTGECPTTYVADYERICESCLRHERYKEVQHYRKVEKSESKFETLKRQISKN